MSRYEQRDLHEKGQARLKNVRRAPTNLIESLGVSSETIRRHSVAEQKEIGLRARAGDKAAQALALAIVAPMIVKFAARFRSNGWPNELVEEIVGDAMVQGMNSLRTYDGTKALTTHLFRCMTERAKQTVRRWKQRGIKVGTHIAGSEWHDIMKGFGWASLADADGVGLDIADTRMDAPAEARPAPVDAAEAIASLTPKAQALLARRYGLGGTRPQSLEEVAKATKRSRLAIRRLEADALRAAGAAEGQGRP